MSGGLMSGGLMSGGLMSGGRMSGGRMSGGLKSYDRWAWYTVLKTDFWHVLVCKWLNARGTSMYQVSGGRW